MKKIHFETPFSMFYVPSIQACILSTFRNTRGGKKNHLILIYFLSRMRRCKLFEKILILTLSKNIFWRTVSAIFLQYLKVCNAYQKEASSKRKIYQINCSTFIFKMKSLVLKKLKYQSIFSKTYFSVFVRAVWILRNLSGPAHALRKRNDTFLSYF